MTFFDNEFSDSMEMDIQVGKHKGTIFTYDITISKSDNLWNYEVSVDDETVINIRNRPETPTSLKNGSKFIKEVSNLGFDEEEIRNNLFNILQLLETNINQQIEAAKEANEVKLSNEKESLRLAGETVYNKFKKNKVDVPRYIASLSRWLVASEEANIIKLVLAIMNTAQGKATNILSEAASGSGKSHIENVAFSLFHDHHYETLNYTTSASFRNKCINDPYIFQNKTVRLGDFGNEMNQDVMDEVTGIIKILNSEGIYKSSKMAKDGETQISITLYGKTAMCYSKVSNKNDISDQDSSRGIRYSPNPTNSDIFKKFALFDNIPNLSDNKEEYVKDLIRDIQDYMEYIIHTDINIVNPYDTQISDILENNRMYRRVLSNELWLLNNIALLDLPNKEIYSINGKDTIFVTVNDVLNYITLYKEDLNTNSQYYANIHGNDLYNLLKKKYLPLNQFEVNDRFQEDLMSIHSDIYEDPLFTDNSEIFFTVKSILNDYRSTNEVNNLISEVNDKEKKIRDTFDQMSDYIGKFRMPDKCFNGNSSKPNLYHLIEMGGSNLLDRLYLNPESLIMKVNGGYEILLEPIIEDFMSLTSQTDIVKKDGKMIFKIDNNMCNILEQHPDIELPPYLNNNEESKQIVDEMMNKYFGTLPDINKKESYKSIESRQEQLALE